MFYYKLNRKILFFFNFIILLLNIVLLFIWEKIAFKKIKYSDLFLFKLYKKTHNGISNYLNNKFKYYHSKNNYILNNKKVIRIKSINLFNETLHYKWLKNQLGDKFDIIIDNQKPDYLIYNVFGNNDKNPLYNNCIRIAIYTENVMPDFNYADYALAHYHINYLDRYFKYNIFLWTNSDNIDIIRKQVLNQNIREKFCAGVISNCFAPFRNIFINKLNNYKKIDMGGSCKNTIGGKVKDKINFLMNYKFSLSLENSGGDGYVTEKIVQSFLAGTIPIYYGDFLVDEYINPKSYILIRGVKDIDKKIEYIKQIDQDEKLYRKIMKEKPIIDDKYINKIEKKELSEFLINIFNQDKDKAFRRDKSFYDYKCSNITY